MCVCLEFYKDDVLVRVGSDASDELPIVGRGGIWWALWGAPTAEYALGPKAPGRIMLRPQGAYADLADVRAAPSPWARWEPQQVRIAIARFLVARGLEGPAEAVAPEWVDLAPGQFLQGLYSAIAERVYVVTIPPPPEYADVKTPWPRIVASPARSARRMMDSRSGPRDR